MIHYGFFLGGFLYFQDFYIQCLFNGFIEKWHFDLLSFYIFNVFFLGGGLRESTLTVFQKLIGTFILLISYNKRYIQVEILKNLK